MQKLISPRHIEICKFAFYIKILVIAAKSKFNLIINKECSVIMISKLKALKTSPVVNVVLIFGVISLFGDLVYEGARGANSQYFNLLGISAAKVGLVFGIGEFLGYFFRLIAGILSDKSKKPWLFIFIGYAMLISVPFIGLTQNWNFIAILILMERLGKSLRNPAKDTVLSGVVSSSDNPDNKIGIGIAFGIQEALDQLGAFGGPLIFTLVFALTGRADIKEYQLGYRFLIIPFILLMLFLIFAYNKVKKHNLIPSITTDDFHSESLSPVFWIYTAFTFFSTLGFVNFSIIGYHLKDKCILNDWQITLIYSGAMAIDALGALIVGRSYDLLKNKKRAKMGGLALLLLIPVLSMMLPIFTLSYSVPLIILGMIIFGFILGLHETIMRSAIADLTPFHKRGTSYGIFNASYGLALLGGSAIIGWLYDQGLNVWITGMALVAELIALILFYSMYKKVTMQSKFK